MNPPAARGEPGASISTPTREDLRAIFDVKYRRTAELGWGPRMRLEFDYFTPDDWYEALVEKLVDASTVWADIGCGRDVFPQHPELARTLADRCRTLWGVDPDPNVLDNPIVHERFHGLVEAFDPGVEFDLFTMRMVAEHVVDPGAVVAKLASLSRPGARVVVFTPYRWAPLSLAAAATPLAVHHFAKRILWGTETRDTFPVAYKLNTRADLARHFGAGGFHERWFSRLDDCRVFSRFRWLNWTELTTRRGFAALGLDHPESCLLGVYEKA